MHSPFKLIRRRYYPVIFILLCICLGAGIGGCKAIGWIDNNQLFGASISALGIAAGFTHFLYSSYMEQTKLFHALAREFNDRYDKLNEHLNHILEQKALPPDLSGERTKAIDHLFDYFNLCAEEYLYFQAGHIDPKVWVSWCVGMKDFAEVADIAKLWREELKRPSYYGFDLDEVIETAEIEIKKLRSRQAS